MDQVKHLSGYAGFHAVFMKNDGGGEISIGLSDARTGVAQHDLSAEHGVQHLMAEAGLSLAFLHPALREQLLEDIVRVLMGAIFLFCRDHIRFPLFFRFV